MSEADKAKIFSAIEHDGTTWQVGSPVPKDTTTIVRKMFFLDGVVEVYAEPNQGTELAGMGACLHFMIMPLGIKLVASVPPRAVWTRMMQETEEGLEFDEEDEEDEDDEDFDDDPAPSNVQSIQSAQSAQQAQTQPVQVTSYVPVIPAPTAPIQTAPNGASEG